MHAMHLRLTVSWMHLVLASQPTSSPTLNKGRGRVDVRSTSGRRRRRRRRRFGSHPAMAWPPKIEKGWVRTKQPETWAFTLSYKETDSPRFPATNIAVLCVWGIPGQMCASGGQRASPPFVELWLGPSGQRRALLRLPFVGGWAPGSLPTIVLGGHSPQPEAKPAITVARFRLWATDLLGDLEGREKRREEREMTTTKKRKKRKKIRKK